ncbi:RIC1-domain-containing protein [Hesseltinella vesiculosa]|uniref:RIC1-domain-containing protein n=1 Tax=Hesseltinella vesiculosa TaxID=101127 RepID=A0A1X2GDC7_9FUNG|nr:RIC1-domain-containing protein [Hesseltinella vesiculosa]
MYWINGIANELSLTSTLSTSVSPAKETLQHSTNATSPPSFSSSTRIISMLPSHHASLFLTCTYNATYLWSTRPLTILSYVKRSDKHIEDFGNNRSILWKPDSSAFVILTDKNYLLLYMILAYDHRSFDFEFPTQQHTNITGPGEGKGIKTMLIKFRLAIRVDAGVTCGACTDDTLIIATQTPPAIQCISWNPQQANTTQTALQQRLGILLDEDEQIVDVHYDKWMNISTWISSKGRAYFIQNTSQRRGSKSSTKSDASTSSNAPSAPSFTEPIHWSGCCFHDDSPIDPATCIAMNAKFSLIAVGTKSGTIYVYNIHNYTSTPTFSHKMPSPFSASQRMDGPLKNDNKNELGSVHCLAWTLDGYALSAGYVGQGGLTVWSVYGAQLCSTEDLEDLVDGVDRMTQVQDAYIHQVKHMFWGPGSHQLFVLSHDDRETIYLHSVPFAKSSLTSFHDGNNARRAMLQLDDGILLYNHAGDYSDNNTNSIDPDAVTWTNILYPTIYITDHWPIRYTAISPDGKYIAIAGRRGLAHFNILSQRWKLFGNQQQEERFIVRGGMVWFKQILVVACEIMNSAHGKSYELHLYSRDQNLDESARLRCEPLKSAPIYITICGTFVLVYTTDNHLNIYGLQYVDGNPGATRLDFVRQMALSGVVARSARVRGISLFHGDCGDVLQCLEDVIHANVLLLVDGKLLLLSPKFQTDALDDLETERDISNGQVTYDLQFLMDKVECYWVGQKSISNLLTSIWAINGKGVKVFSNVLRSDGYGFHSFNRESYFESEPTTPTSPNGNFFTSHNRRSSYTGKPYSLGYHIGVEPSSPHSHSWLDIEGESRWQTDLTQLQENSIYIPLDFYPHAILLDKGVIVGMEQSIVYRESLGFLIYKINTKTHLFLHHLIRFLLHQQLDEDAVVFARAYERLLYFSHALEILLHNVLEEEAEAPPSEQNAILPLVIRFLDQFPHALDVIVSCARKTEVALWDHLFASLCLTDGRLRTATSYLIILQTMQPLTTGAKDIIRLLQKAMEKDDFDLCKELVRFLSSIDHSGKSLHEALLALKDDHILNSDIQPLQS